MREELAVALEPVLHDLARTGGVRPEIRDNAWLDEPNTASTWLSPGDESAVGVWIDLAQSSTERVVAVADQVQEWAVETLAWLGRPTNWPACPYHPDNHPLAATERGGKAMWICPANEVEVSEIGSVEASGEPHEPGA